LPQGLILDEALGVITGTPASAGTASFELESIDAAGKTVTGNFNLTIGPGNWKTTYYVDSTAGNDANSGTSSSTPWKTVAKVNSASFAPGDRILFKRGGTWRDELRISSSGLQGQPILVDAYGSGAAPKISGADVIPGTAWKACTTCGSNVWEAVVKTQPNVVVLGGKKGNHKSGATALSAPGDWYWSGGTLYAHSSGNPASSYPSPGVEAGSRGLALGLFGVSYVTVQGLEFDAANGLPTNGVIYAQPNASRGESTHDVDFNGVTVTNGAGDGIHLVNCNYCMVQNATITGMARAGIMLVSNSTQYPITAGATVGNRVFGNHYDGISVWGCAIGSTCGSGVAAKGAFLTGLIISGNTTHDNGAGIYVRWTNHSSVEENSSYNNTDTSMKAEGYGIGVEASSNNTIEKNLLYGNRTRGVELSNDAGAGTTLTGSSNNIVAYNAIHDNGDHGIFTNDAPTQSNQFLYNVIWNHEKGDCFLANGTGHVFYGNTCWNNSTGVDLYTSSATPTTGNIKIENNIFSRNNVRAVHIEKGVTLSSLTVNYNAYDQNSGTEFAWSGGAGLLKAWQALGFDKNSIIASPNFLSAVSTAAAGDFAVQAASPTVGMGTNLGAAFAMGLKAGSTWPSGVQTSPQGLEWEIGSFPQNP